MISSISAGGFSLKFDRYSKRVSKSGKCQYCGKQTTRSTTFEMHKSIFNTNPDGTEMSVEEINANLQAKAADWKANMEVYHNGCRRSLVINRLRSEGFVCSENSDCIDVHLSPSWYLTVNYDTMRVRYNGITKTTTLDDLVTELIAYREKYIKERRNEIIVDTHHVWINEEHTKKSGKTFIHTALSTGTMTGHASCDLRGIGDTKDDAFINSLEALVALGEKAKNYLEKRNDRKN